MSDLNKREDDDVQFMFDASCEVLEGNYEKAVFILRQGIEKSLLESNEPIESERLLHTLGLLISCVEESLKNNFGINLNNKTKVIYPENTCSFCGASKSEVETLVAGANGYICNSCVRTIYLNLDN